MDVPPHVWLLFLISFSLKSPVPMPFVFTRSVVLPTLELDAMSVKLLTEEEKSYKVRSLVFVECVVAHPLL